jgi:antitoxin (DNA-binding transcriptional repressor) of toxin-antitoxin stability system
METVSIRDLRGAALRKSARQGRPLAITNHRVLIAVVIPVATAWVEHLIEYNWSRVRQGVDAGEQAIASGVTAAALDHVVAGEYAVNYEEKARGHLEGLAASVTAAVVNGTVEQAPQSKSVIEGLQAALNPDRKDTEAEDTPAVRSVRIGDLSAGLIEQAGETGQTLALTHDRELIGMVIPVTQGLVQFLIEQNMARVLHSVALGEKQLGTADKLTTLDQVSDPGTS